MLGRELAAAVAEFVDYQRDVTVPIGRDHEQRLLFAALDGARSGSGRLLLIAGEAGIGKTTIVEHFLSRARQAEITILAGACFDVAAPSPYAAWKDALLQVERSGEASTEYGHWLSDEHLALLSDQNALFNDIQQRITRMAETRPLVLVLEDIHWADRESLELLRFLGRSIRAIPALIIATYRNDEIVPGQALYDTLPHLVREARAERVDLRRFTTEAIRDTVDTRYRLDQSDSERLVEELERRTDGNPFFIIELLHSMEMAGLLYEDNGAWRLGQLSNVEIPLLVRQLIDRRFLRLDDAGRSALLIASILGYEVRPDIWRAVSENDEVELSRTVQQALDNFLLEQSPHGDSLRFRHALVREALYTSMPLPWRQMHHRRVAETLAESPGADPAMVAEHFRSGGDPRAAEWALNAARYARRFFAPHAIIRHLNEAFDPQSRLTEHERIEVFKLRGWAHEISGEFDAADRDYHAMLRTALDAKDRYSEWEGLICLAELWAARDYRQAHKYVEQALRVAEAIGDESLAAHSLNRLGNWHMNYEDPDRAQACHDRALEIFRTIDDQPGIAATEDLLAMTLAMGGNSIDAQHHFERAISRLKILDDQQALSSSLANASHCGAIYPTDMVVPARTTLDECIASAEEGLTSAAEINHRAGEVYALIRLGSCSGSRGDYQAAIDSVARGIAGAEEIDHRQWLCAARSVEGTILLDLLDAESASVRLEQALTIAEDIGSGAWIASSTGFLATAYLAMGRRKKAASVLEPIWTKQIPAKTIAQRHVWCARIELALARNDTEKALRLIDWMLESTPHASRERPPIRLSLLRGRALIARQAYEEAESWLLPARDVAREQRALPLAWRIHRELGAAKSAHGKRVSASDEFAEAHRIIEELGNTLADPDMRTRFLTAAHGQVPEGWAPTLLQSAKKAFSGLTRRQREVAALIAAGRSNREIADSLSISERTVETHVTAILSTLDLSSRAQIAAWCVENSLVSPQHP